MSLHRGRLLGVTCVALLAGLSGQGASSEKADKTTHADVQGEPLPEGTLARLGSIRFRSDGASFALSHDAKTIALKHRNVVRICDLRTFKERVKLEGGNDASPDVLGFSPDDKSVATRDKETLTVWDATTGKSLWQFQGEERSATGAFTPDSKHFVGWATDHSVRVWDALTGKLIREQKLSADAVPLRIRVTSDGKTLAAPIDRYTLCLWDVASGKTIRTLPRQDSPISWLAFAPHGELLASVNDDIGDIHIWNAATGKDVVIPLANPIYPVSLKFSHDGKYLASENKDLTEIHVWDTANGRHLHVFDNENMSKGFAFSPDGKTMALGDTESIRLVELPGGRVLHQVEANPSALGALVFTRDGKTLVARDGKTIRLWQVQSGAEIAGLPGHLDDVRYLAFAPGGKTIASSGKDGSIRLWEAKSGKYLRQLRRSGSLTANLAFSPDGKAVASFGKLEDGNVRVFDIDTAKQRFEVEQAPVRTGTPNQQDQDMGNMEAPRTLDIVASFSADSKLLGVASLRSPSIRILDAASGDDRTILGLGPGGGVVDAFAFSPDGRIIAVARTIAKNGDTAELRDIATGRVLARLEMETDDEAIIQRLLFSPDGKLLASVQEGTIRVWETATRKQVHELKREDPNETFLGVGFTPNGRLLALAGAESPPDALNLWDVFAGKKLHRFEVPGNEILGQAISPDGSMLATAMRDTTVLIWDLRAVLKEEETQPDPIDSAGLDRLWADLAGGNAGKGFQAVQTLSTVPAQAVALLKKHLRPVPESETRRVGELIRDLSSRKFLVRKKAMQELVKEGEMAELVLRRTLADTLDLELRLRIELLLHGREGAEPSPDVLRVLRAVQILELIGDVEAKHLLDALAKGAPEAWLTLEAKEAMKRLGRRPS
jgi:WD40 repeat protein